MTGSLTTRFVWTLGCLLMCTGIFAQTIRVTDATSRQSVPGALVTLTSVSGTLRQGVSNENGVISFPAVSEKQFLQVRMTGFATWKDSIQPHALSVNVYLLTKTDSLNEVVVTAQYGETNTDNTVQPVRVIDRSRIDAQGAQNLSDVLSTELNIRRSQDQVLGSSMSVQGLSGENV
ncbi:MAG TPA: hypothetical protein VK826_17335, partial [Bacteroidia bacterium]|nr:hypothetical protein [Bacteroidia bacterium]